MWGALRFTFLEAGLSAFFSCLIGTILAWIWLRKDWPWKTEVESLFLLSFFTPPLFIVMAVIGFYGRSFLGLNIYGLNGIVLAHILLNAPLVFYLLLSAWRGVASETLMLAQNLGQVHTLIERPLWRRVLPAAFGLVFLYSALSFTIVLVLGGGPASTTLEFAIYDAIRNRFDLRLAFWLSLVQAGLGLSIYFLLRRDVISDLSPSGFLPKLCLSKTRAMLSSLALIIMGFFLVFPLIWLLIRGIWQWPLLFTTVETSSLLHALFNSLYLALIYALLVNLWAVFQVWRHWEGLSWVMAAISPLVLATFFFFSIRPFANPFDLGLIFILFIQVLASAPLFVRIWRVEFDKITDEERMLLASLAINWRQKWTQFYWPRFKGAAIRVLSIGVALALGDLALYPLMAPVGFSNLPMLVWQMMANYRFPQAAALGGLMIMLIAVILMFGQWAARYSEKKYAPV